MLSKRSKYALKALVALAKNTSGEPLRISQIAEQESIPRKFLEAILLDLRKQGFLGSKMGVNGGYYLTMKPSEIMLSNIIRITDGPIALIPCVSLNFYERCEECADEATCGIRDMALQVRDASLKILTNTSLANIVARERKLTAQKPVKKKK